MKKTMTLLLIFTMIFVMAPGTTWAGETDEANAYFAVTIEGVTKYYDTSVDAFNSIQSGQNAEVILLKDYTGGGVAIGGEKKEIHIDLGGNTWQISTPLVGSTGTETNGFQLLQGNEISFKNGKIASSTAKILIQNYASVVFDDVDFELKTPGSGHYALSNNNGKTVLKNGTTVSVPTGCYAMDSFCFGSYSGGDVWIEDAVITGDMEVTNGGRMTINGGVIHGDIKVYNYQYDASANKIPELTVAGGTIEGDIDTANLGQTEIKGGDITGSISKTAENTAQVIVTGGTFSDDSAASFVPAGTNLVCDETTGKYGPQPAESAAAQIGSCGYTTLEAAISAAEAGDTVKLLQSYGNGTSTITIPAEKDVTLDLNGQTLNAPLVNNGKVVITGNGTVKRTGTGYGIKNEAGAVMVIENGTFPNNTEDTNESALVRNLGTLTINGGQFTDDHIVVKNDDASSTVYGTLVINGGTFDGGNVRQAQDGLGYATIQNSGKMTINGGQFSGGNQTVLSLLYDAPTSTIIKGGSFTNEDGKAFNSYKDTNGNAVQEAAENIIYGGTFSSNVSDYLADGLKQNSNGQVVTESTGGYYPPEVQKPIIETNGNCTVTLSSSGRTATIEVADGYELEDVTVNGVSQGKVTMLTGLRTGDKVVVTTAILADPQEELIEKIQSTQLVARSQMSKAKGKKAVKITWYEKEGYDLDFDGYEIYRSLKRYSGFGTKPIFTTEKDTYHNTLIKTGAKYYYKVRGYIMVDGEKVYTPWSLKAWRTVK